MADGIFILAQKKQIQNVEEPKIKYNIIFDKIERSRTINIFIRIVMSQPDYPIFSKRIQRNQRNHRGTYNFDKTNEYTNAEKWFQERLEHKKVVKTPSTPVRLPPGIPIPTLTSKKCVKCLEPSSSPVMMACCSSSFCFRCSIEQANITNRCTHCNKVINQSKYEEYDGLDLKVPSYDDFHYIDPDDIYTVPIVENQCSSSLVISAEENPVTEPHMIDYNYEESMNYQLNLQYSLFTSMYLQYLQQ